MIHQNVELHNIAEVKTIWNGSAQMQRVPESVREYLNDGAKGRCLSAANAEIRFVADSPKVRISLCGSTSGYFYVAYGTFLDKRKFPLTTEQMTYELEIPANILKLKEEYKKELPFDTNVFRVLLPRTTVNLFFVEGDNVRPPVQEQLPSLRYLAYGTSITEGACSTAGHLSYVGQTARKLGADVINLGMAGSCQAEKEMADYIASRKDWDIATLALSVNMLGFEPEEFEKRVEYMVNTVAGSDITRPVVCITLYPYFGFVCKDHGDAEKAELFRQILRDVVKRSPYQNVDLVEGSDILTEIDGLSSDMIHPSDYGMNCMSSNLAAKLKDILANK